MSELVRYLILICICSAFTAPASINAASQGFLEGQLKIISGRPVALDDENPSRPNWPPRPAHRRNSQGADRGTRVFAHAIRPRRYEHGHRCSLKERELGIF